MEPRLKSSTQWSPFPEELCQQAVDVLTERFSSEYDLEDGQFVVEGFIYKEEIIGRYGLRFDGQIKQPNFEISMEFNPEKDKPLEMIQDAMDVVEHLWTELLEDDLNDSDLAKKWQTMPYQKKMYFYRYSTVNTELEKEADKLLEEYEKKLLYQTADYDLPGDSSNEDPTNTLH